MLTYSAIKTRVIAIVRPGSGTTYATECLQACNFAQLRMARMHDFHEMCKYDATSYDTVDGQAYVTLGAAVKTVYNFAIEDGTDTCWIKPYPFQQIDSAFPYPPGDSEGQPEYGLLWDAVDASNIPCLKMFLVPIPDAAYDVLLRYSAWPTDFADSGTEYSDFKNKDDLIIAGACAEWFTWIERPDRAAYWENVFQRKMKEAVRDDKRHNVFLEMQPWALTQGAPPDYWSKPFYKG